MGFPYWMSDVMHGPAVPDGRRRRKTYLAAFIDDATRVVPFATFAFAENTATYLPALKQAILRRGLPARLYVDNGANYRSRQLSLVCARLGVALIHARPYQPAAKGKIERWFRTLRGAWLNHLDLDAIDGLDALNRRLWAWVEGEYHNSPHRGLDGETPLDRWAAAGADVRYPDPGPAFDDLFMFEAKRRVMKDRTVSLHGRLYEVEAVLIGDTVILRYDPQAPSNRPLQVLHDGRPAGMATVLDAYANTAVRRLRSSRIVTDEAAPEPPPSPIAWELGLAEERSRATAYRAIRNEVTRLVTEAKQLPVLIVDEAQHLRNDVLEDLRLLTNFNMDADRRLCLLLVGLTELRRRLAMAVHESLSQRLVVRHQIGGLARDELDDYLGHRLRLAGCELPLFEPPAVEALYQGSRGLPRPVNRIAHYALSAAALAKARTVDATHMQLALDELRL